MNAKRVMTTYFFSVLCSFYFLKCSSLTMDVLHRQKKRLNLKFISNTYSRSLSTTRILPSSHRKLDILPHHSNINPKTPTSLHSFSKNDQEPSQIQSNAAATTTPTQFLDSLLTILTSDIGSIVLGTIGLIICLINRLSLTMDDSNVLLVTGQQSRSDLLAVMAAGSVLLNGITKLDITSALAETVELEGIDTLPTILTGNLDEEYTHVSDLFCNDPIKRRNIEWALSSILSCTTVKSATLMIHPNQNIIQSKWLLMAYGGIIPSSLLSFINDSDSTKKSPFIINQNTPILDRFLSSPTSTTPKKESYLPTLQALPGKVEFMTYLPINTQEVLCLPISTDSAYTGVLVLGSDTAKSLSPRDIAWCQVIASRLGSVIFS